jgi:hypothetical protein
MGHQERFTPPSLRDRCGFTEGTFAGTSANGRDAPKAAMLKGRFAKRAACPKITIAPSPPLCPPPQPEEFPTIMVRQLVEELPDPRRSGTMPARRAEAISARSACRRPPQDREFHAQSGIATRPARPAAPPRPAGCRGGRRDPPRSTAISCEAALRRLPSDRRPRRSRCWGPHRLHSRIGSVRTAARRRELRSADDGEDHQQGKKSGGSPVKPRHHQAQ